MHKQIFVNLPVKDIGKTREFFASLGFAFNPQFSDERALCMIIGENIYAMLLQESYFQTFTTKPVADARTSTEVLTCLSCDSREQVDSLVAKALAGGGRTPNASQDHGFMYYHAFEDIDGNGWEFDFEDIDGHGWELDSSRTKWVCPYPIVIMKNIMPVGQAARLLGSTVGSLQHWEREGRLVAAARTASNRRRNTENQLHTGLESSHAAGASDQA